MIKIWKFVLQVADRQTVEIPLPAKVLSVQVQPTPEGETVCLWAEVRPEQEKVKVPIVIAGTGHTLPEVGNHQYLRHISTFQMHNGQLVFHAYEVVSRH